MSLVLEFMDIVCSLWLYIYSYCLSHWFYNSWILYVPFGFTSIATVCVIWFYNSWVLYVPFAFTFIATVCVFLFYNSWTLYVSFGFTFIAFGFTMHGYCGCPKVITFMTNVCSKFF